MRATNPPTLNQLLAILSIVVIPLLIWGVSVEIRFAETNLRLNNGESNITEMKKDVKEIKEVTNEILIEVKSNHKKSN